MPSHDISAPVSQPGVAKIFLMIVNETYMIRPQCKCLETMETVNIYDPCSPQSIIAWNFDRSELIHYPASFIGSESLVNNNIPRQTARLSRRPLACIRLSSHEVGLVT